MTGFIPTTQVTVLETKTERDEFGDDRDVYARSKRLVPAHISEVRAQVPDPSTGSLSTIVNYLALLPGNTKIERGVRIIDQKTDTTYVVERVRKRNTFVGVSPLRVELQLVS